MRILLVEADTAVAAWLRATLEQQGHTLREVRSGGAALTAALAEEFDLLVCDVQLPDLHGTEIVRALKAQSPMLPVMTLGDGEVEQWTQPCLDAGASCYLPKPISVEALGQEVALVEKARLHLRTILVDTDPIHRTRLSKSLAALGCEVASFEAAGVAQRRIAEDPASGGLLIVDAGAAGVLELLRIAKEHGLACFAFQDQIDEAAEDALMRAGAAFLMRKPVDVDQMLTQAAFIAAA